MREAPDRGRIVIVNFEKDGTATPPEMVGTQRPCVVVQNNALQRGALVTLVPLSTTEPQRPGKQHHRMSHLSFRGWPGLGRTRNAALGKVRLFDNGIFESVYRPVHKGTVWRTSLRQSEGDKNGFGSSGAMRLMGAWG